MELCELGVYTPGQPGRRVPGELVCVPVTGALRGTRTPGPQGCVAVSVFADILGNGDSSRLYETLVT